MRLVLLMGMMTICSMILAQENVAEEQDRTEIRKEVTQKEVNELTPEEMMERIQKEGRYIGKSKTHDNIKTTIEAIWADQYTYKILICVEHIDKTPFGEETDVNFRGQEFLSKQNYEKMKILNSIPERTSAEEAVKVLATNNKSFKQFIKSDGSIDVEGYKQYIDSIRLDLQGTNMYGPRMKECQVKGIPAYKQYLIMEGSVYEEIEGESIISLEAYLERSLKTYNSQLDLAAYLKAHKNDVLRTVPNKRAEDKRESFEPREVLEDNGLRLEVLKGIDDYYILDIGFIDDALHIRFNDSRKNKYIAGLYKNGKEVSKVYSRGLRGKDAYSTSISTWYEVYPIKNIEELKKYKLQVKSREDVAYIEDEFTFEIKNKPITGTTKAVHKGVKLDNYNYWILKDITQTNLSLKLTFEQAGGPIYAKGEMTLIFKDGTKAEIKPVVLKKVNNEAIYIYDIGIFNKVIDKIILGDLEIQ